MQFWQIEKVPYSSITVTRQNQYLNFMESNLEETADMHVCDRSTQAVYGQRPGEGGSQALE